MDLQRIEAPLGAEEMAPVNNSNDDDDNRSAASSSSSSDSSTSVAFQRGGMSQEERDEVKEIERYSKFERAQVEMTRWVVVFLLVYSIMTILLSINAFLQEDIDARYQRAYTQFSSQLAEASMTRMTQLESTLSTLSTQVSLMAAASTPTTGEYSNSTWPYVTVPSWTLFAADVVPEWSSALVLAPLIPTDESGTLAWLDYAQEHHEVSLQQEHMIQYGNLDQLMEIFYQNKIWTTQEEASVLPSYSLPYWQAVPVPNSYAPLNYDLARSPALHESLEELLAMESSKQELHWTHPIIPGSDNDQEDIILLSSATSSATTENDKENGLPYSYFVQAVYEEAHDTASPVMAVLLGKFQWNQLMDHVLPPDVQGLTVVVQSSCQEETVENALAYELSNGIAHYIPLGDPRGIQARSTSHGQVVQVILQPDSSCPYTVNIYPTAVFEDDYDSDIPMILAIVLAGCFFLMALVFCMYDASIRFQINKILTNAAMSNAIVSQFFPGQFRDQIMGNKDDSTKTGDMDQSTKTTSRPGWAVGSKSKMKMFLSGGIGLDDDKNSKPLADLFLETTVILADIVGFTAWSSVREPSQVFTLLETVYGHFDTIARKRRIFKVETVGDCYVAVCGLPDPRKDHAVAMARFARDILASFLKTVTDLESTLGPDTGDLDLRLGMHSGPVTAGVLRGERSRFQLFGDTINTGARMESTSKPGHIQMSRETADLLIEAGKQAWLEEREGGVTAKGKGVLQTFWLIANNKKDLSSSIRSNGQDSSISRREEEAEATTSIEQDVQGMMSERTKRLISWNTEALFQLIRKIVARREAREACPKTRQRNKSLSAEPSSSLTNEEGGIGSPTLKEGATFLEEVKEIIELPGFDKEAEYRQRDPREVEVDPAVYTQLRDYVTSVAMMYRANPFHNFEHASHVTMSVTKLLSRIVAPNEIERQVEKALREDASGLHNLHSSLHDHTYGITSDPLTQFACAFSALIHDVDHLGVPNTQLMKEQPYLAALYKNRSIAEQNSLQLSWALLMDSHFEQLRQAVFPTVDELKRFRELVVNSVMATDIADKDLKVLRNARWDKAFGKNGRAVAADSPKDAINRKATIVIEHLIQASDISHTMQHWHVFRKWNERLFAELYAAYRTGRADKNPADFWAKGEIGFFDFYIIPLAKKLKDCGVFGVSSDEFLNYAENNRREWESKGEQIVAEMIAKYSQLSYEEHSELLAEPPK